MSRFYRKIIEKPSRKLPDGVICIIVLFSFVLVYPFRDFLVPFLLLYNHLLQTDLQYCFVAAFFSPSLTQRLRLYGNILKIQLVLLIFLCYNAIHKKPLWAIVARQIVSCIRVSFMMSV